MLLAVVVTTVIRGVASPNRKIAAAKRKQQQLRADGVRGTATPNRTRSEKIAVVVASTAAVTSERGGR